MLVQTPMRFNYGGMYPDINYDVVNGRMMLDRGPFLSGLGTLSTSNLLMLGLGVIAVMWLMNKG